MRVFTIGAAAIAVFMSAFMTLPAFAQNKGAVERQFKEWLKNDLWPEAQSNGVSASTFNSALASATIKWDLPDLVTPGTKPKETRPQAQAEFRSPARYFNENNIQPLVRTGKQLAAEHRTLISRIEQQYGVPGRILLAIWGRESAFGRVKIPHNSFQVLATKAFMSTRPALFRKEVLAALQIVEDGYATPSMMRSSWAGAMGQPQFLPSSYLEYAVDFDGDGRRDIWNSVPDTLASIANYLARYGWQRGRDWGYEAIIPNRISCAQEGPDKMRTIIDWVKLGAKRISGKSFPPSELNERGGILLPAGRSGPVFISTPNFYVIKKYNNSDLYALFVGNLADRIAYGSGPFQAPWQAVTGLKRGQVMAMQERLIREGYDVGGADGLAGFKTRRSIGAWQSSNGMRPTCFPSRELVRLLK